MEPKEIRTCDIRRIVEERLSGFRVRQMERDEVRKKKRKKKSAFYDGQECIPETVGLMRSVPEKTKQKYEGEPAVKSNIVFRATFEFPIGPLNPANWRLAGKIEVEVFQKKVGPPAEWRARRPGMNIEFKITSQSRHDTLQLQIVGTCFEEQRSDWEAFDPHGKLEADEMALDRNGQPYVTELRRLRLSERKIHECAERARTAALPAQPEEQKGVL